MDELLTQVLDAHGGLENWSKVSTLTAKLSLGGPFWAGRGWPGIYDDATAELDAHRQHIVFTPFNAPDRPLRWALGIGVEGTPRVQPHEDLGAASFQVSVQPHRIVAGVEDEKRCGAPPR
jgi:hypothetical protein